MNLFVQSLSIQIHLYLFQCTEEFLNITKICRDPWNSCFVLLHYRLTLTALRSGGLRWQGIEIWTKPFVLSAKILRTDFSNFKSRLARLACRQKIIQHYFSKCKLAKFESLLPLHFDWSQNSANCLGRDRDNREKVYLANLILTLSRMVVTVECDETFSNDPQLQLQKCGCERKVSLHHTRHSVIVRTERNLKDNVFFF